MRGYSSTAKTILAPTVAREESAGLPTTEPSRAAWSIQIIIYIIIILLLWCCTRQHRCTHPIDIETYVDPGTKQVRVYRIFLVQPPNRPSKRRRRPSMVDVKRHYNTICRRRDHYNCIK